MSVRVEKGRETGGGSGWVVQPVRPTQAESPAVESGEETAPALGLCRTQRRDEGHQSHLKPGGVSVWVCAW